MLELGQTRGLRDFGRKEDVEPPERRPPCPATPAWGGGRGCRPQPPSLPSWAGWCPRFSSCGLQGSPANSFEFHIPLLWRGLRAWRSNRRGIKADAAQHSVEGSEVASRALSMAAFPGSLLFARSPAKSNFTPRDVEGNLRTRGPSPRDQRLLFAAAHG